MALLHRATLAPSKQELVESWLPTRSWSSGRTVAAKLAEYRFDDPAGEVGVETILWRTDDGAVLQTPLTYRAAPLEGAEIHLIGTSEHSVLGPRWVYDGCGDPVWVATLATAILSGATQAQMFFEEDGRRVDVPSRMQVRGSGGDSAGDLANVTSVDSVIDEGAVTLVRAGDVELTLARVLGAPLDGRPTLIGRIGDADETSVLASLRRC
jgi:maltokinase-like protein